MKIYANKELGLRRGKWTSQISHSLMKYFLLNCTYCKETESYLIPSEKYNAFKSIVDNAINGRNNIDIIWVANSSKLEEQELALSPYTASIIDHARTELKVPTKTCFAYDDTERFIPVDDLIFTEQDADYKQVIALSRNFPKPTQFSLGASMSLSALLDQFEKDGELYRLSFERNTNYYAWLKGAFAKITVKFQDDNEIKVLISKARDNGIYVNEAYLDGKLACVTFGAAENKVLDEITGNLKLY